MRKDLTRLMSPKSVAILGGRWADLVEQNCRNFGFQGPIFRVHPQKAAAGVEGFWPSLEALPTVPDCTFLGINRDATIDAVRLLRELGAGGAVCLASGFAERSGDGGVDFNTRLLDAAGDFPFLGPNCLGFVNFFDRISLFPDPAVTQSVDRGVCVISQSGTVACDVLFSNRHLPIGKVFSAGNQSSVTSVDLAYAALEDPRVSAIGMYLESMGDPTDLRDLACAAQERRIPILILKPGRTESARSIALSHTGAMAGTERYLDALLQRVGVGRCDSIAEFVETLKLLHVHGPFAGNRLAISGGSGGDMAIASDLLEKVEVQLPLIKTETKDALSKSLGDQVTLGNPLDFQTFIWHDEEKLCQMFSVFQDGDADLYGFFLDHPNLEAQAHKEELPIRAFLAAARKTGAKAFIASTMPESTPAFIADMALKSGVAPMQGMSETFRAFEIAAAMGSSWANFKPPRLDRRAHNGSIRNLNEFDAKQMLSSAGIKTPRSAEVFAKDAPRTAETIGFPVVMKVSSQSIQHKTELNGVALNVDNVEKAEMEAARLGAITEKILVEEMVHDGIAEFIVGVNVDDEFGPVVLIGAGGVLAELLKDSIVLLPPFSRQDVLSALKTLRSFRLLSGYRRRPMADVDALISVVMSVAELIQDPAACIFELEINPIIVRAQGLGAVAVDSLIRLRGEE
ncbi:acetate--CoA ligase family protein [Mesorhizobium sp. M1312]|uniref:acetate--CoA ligase family protein n=1 Tax=unclassified Mesorhizobium TaxID=325217 RepID=UPI003335968E